MMMLLWFKVFLGIPQAWSACPEILPLWASILSSVKWAHLGLMWVIPDPAGLEGFLVFNRSCPTPLPPPPIYWRPLRSMQFQNCLLPKPQSKVRMEGTQRPGITQPQGHYCEPCLLLITKLSFSLLIKMPTDLSKSKVFNLL